MKQANNTVGALRHRSRAKLTPAQRWVIVLSLLVLTLGLVNLARAVLAWRYDVLLPDLPMTVPLTYLTAMGSFWGLVFVICTVGLVRFRRWGRWGTLVATILYEVHVWINHLLFAANDYALQTRPRDLALTLLLLIFICGPLNLAEIRKVFKS
ncbi:MAG: hypothetical protein GY832_45675 [Chloroflexi bacterium]|nr:hypothetical protein [Chloroflexota bacterium]